MNNNFRERKNSYKRLKKHQRKIIQANSYIKGIKYKKQKMIFKIKRKITKIK